MSRTFPWLRSALFPTTVLALAACSDPTGGAGTQATLSVATRRATPNVSGPALAPQTFTDGTNTLVVSRVQVVLRELEIEHADPVAGCDPALPEDDDCDEELKLGPILLDLPLGAGVTRQFSVAITPGRYKELEIEVHRTSSGNAQDAAFLAAHPAFDGVSIRVEGTWNGEPFVYTSALNVEMEFDFNPPLVAAEGAGLDLTLFVDVDGWFRNGSAQLVSPASAGNGQPNASMVEENIKASFEAFEDDDRDGQPD